MRCVRLGLHYLHAAQFIPAPDEIAITLESVGGRQLLCAVALPQASHRVAEGGDAAFGGDAGAGQEDDVVCGA